MNKFILTAIALCFPLAVLGQRTEIQPREEWHHIKQQRIGRYRVLYPKKVVPGKAYPLVVLIHGNGNGPETMLRWAREFKNDSVIFICPEAPYLKIVESINEKKERFTAMADPMAIPDSMIPDAITLSANWYHSVIYDALATLPADRSIRPFLIGFSQGGFYAHVLLTRYPEAFSAVVSVCASMYSAGNVVERYASIVPYGIRIMVAHGRQDSIVPFQTGELIHAALRNARVEHTYIPFDGQHWPSQAVTDSIRGMMRLR